jgi:hypothetical protein
MCDAGINSIGLYKEVCRKGTNLADAIPAEYLNLEFTNSYENIPEG